MVKIVTVKTQSQQAKVDTTGELEKYLMGTVINTGHSSGFCYKACLYRTQRPSSLNSFRLIPLIY